MQAGRGEELPPAGLPLHLLRGDGRPTLLFRGEGYLESIQPMYYAVKVNASRLAGKSWTPPQPERESGEMGENFGKPILEVQL